jgi:hypothetical protein
MTKLSPCLHKNVYYFTGQSQTVGPGVEGVGQTTRHLPLCATSLCLTRASQSGVPPRHSWWAQHLPLTASRQESWAGMAAQPAAYVTLSLAQSQCEQFLLDSKVRMLGSLFHTSLPLGTDSGQFYTFPTYFKPFLDGG